MMNLDSESDDGFLDGCPLVEETILAEPRVIAIYIGAIRGQAMTAVDTAQALSGQGLMGDRYFNGRASKAPEQEITLIESEAIEAVNRDSKIPLEARETRRNVVTQGIALNHLVGKTFRVGEAVLEGLELCEPCSRLQKLTRPGILKALLHRGGLRARIVTDGLIQTGDTVEPLESAVLVINDSRTV